MASENDLDLELDDIEMDLDDITGFQDSSPADPEGVWVKSGPEDVPPSAQKAEALPDPTAAPEAEETSFFGEEDSLSPEELAKLGDSFDFVEASDEPLEGEALEDDTLELDDLSLNEDFGTDELSLDDDDLGEELVIESKDEAADNPEGIESAGEDFDEISLDDFVSFDEDVDPSGGIKEPGAVPEAPAPLPSEDETQEEFLDIDIDIEDEVPDSELEIYEEEKKNAVDEVSLDEFLGEEVEGAEEVDISDFGDFEVEDISDEEMGFTPEQSSAEVAAPDPETPSEPMPTLADEDALPSIDDDISFDDGQLEEPINMEEASLETNGETPVDTSTDDLDDFSELTLDDEEVEVELGDEFYTDTDSDSEELVETDDYFEDIPIEEGEAEDFSKDFEDTLSMEKEPSVDFSEDFGEEGAEYEEVISTMEPNAEDMDSISALEEDLTKGIKEPAPAQGADAILQKIESELSSIKNELGDLKKEISGLRRVDGHAGPVSEERGQGFFIDDEDETIALTGEELDNILTSADITEDSEGAQEDLISTDDEGKIIQDIPQSDEELFEGTDLQDSLDEEVELPDTSSSHPIPGGDGFAEADLALDAAEDEPVDSIPEEITLIEDDSAQVPEIQDHDVETEDLLGDGPEQIGEDSISEEGFEITDNTLPDMEDVDKLSMAQEEISTDEINFEESETSINLDSDFESVDIDQMSEEEVLEEEESLEIPFDEELSLEEDSLDVPNLESPPSAIAEPTADEKQADAQAAREAFPDPTLGEEALTPQGPANSTPAPSAGGSGSKVPENLRNEIANVLKYMDNLLDALPDEKIQEFAESEHFEVYKKLFEDLGLME